MQMSVTIDLILIIINLGGDSHHGLGFFIPNPKNTIHIRFNRLGTQAWINSRNFEMLVCHGHAFMDTFRTKMNILNIIHIIGLLQKSSINSTNFNWPRQYWCPTVQLTVQVQFT